MAARQELIDWPRWLERWDRQQEGYVPEREARFAAMFDALALLLPPSFVAVDVACGPGSLSRRVLARFPQARVVAVDVDPVMLAVGEGAIGTVDGRLRWVDADLATPEWVAALGETQVDAVLSSTALHWLGLEPLTRVYGELAELLRPGGVLLNGDHIVFPPELPSFRRLDDHVLDQQWTDEAFAARGLETAEQWWEAIAAEPAIEELLAERTRRFAAKQRPIRPDFDQHVAALRGAGFREVGSIWQVLSDRVLMAIR
jgi:trans-aconitate methyltransferase